MSGRELQVACNITTNPQVVNVYSSVRGKYLRLTDYSFYTYDTIINAYNNTMTVNGTVYTIDVGNYNNTAGSFAGYLSTLIPGLTVTYDQNISGKFSFAFAGVYTLSVPTASLRRVLGLTSSNYSGGAGTLVGDYPAHFTNSDFYYIDITEAKPLAVYTPPIASTYVVSNNASPGSLLKHRSAEMLPVAMCTDNTIQKLTISVKDQYGNLVPIDGSTWYFYVDILNKCD